MDYFEALIQSDNAKLIESAWALARLRPDSVQAHLLLALAATVQAQDSNLPQDEFLDLAQSSYEKALQADPNNAHAHAVYGDFLAKRGRKTEALAQSEAALTLDPNDRLALLGRLSLLPPAQTKDTAHRLIGIDPNDPFYWFYYSSSLLNLNEHQEALAAAQKAVDLDPNGLFYGGLADALMGVRRMDEAEKHYKLMTERCKCQQCWYKYASFLVAHRPEKMDEARHALDMVESRAGSERVPPKDIRVLKLLLLEKTAPPEAETLARKLLEAAPEEAVYWWHLASILRTQERHAEAAEAAGKAVELDPNASYRARLANCLAKAGDLEAAQRVYDEMFARHPERQRYWYWYAEFLADYHPDRIDEARAALEKAATLSDGDKSWSVPAADLAELEARLDTRQEILQ